MMMMAFHSKGGGEKGNGACGQDTDGDEHIINQLRKIIDLEMPMQVKFLDKSHVLVDFCIASILLDHYDGLRTSIEKERMTHELWANAVNFQKLYHDKYTNNNKKEYYHARTRTTMGAN